MNTELNKLIEQARNRPPMAAAEIEAQRQSWARYTPDERQAMPNLRRLRGLRTYLAGAMDEAADGGCHWRRAISPWLRAKGVTVLDPTCKPIDLGNEEIEDINYRKQLLDDEQYDQIAYDMRLVRCTDLRMVDLVDFLVVNIDKSIYTTGTVEEITNGNRSKKPIIVRCEGGKRKLPQWYFGMFPHATVFATWGEVREYLDFIDHQGQNDRRWYFFDFDIPQEAIASNT